MLVGRGLSARFPGLPRTGCWKLPVSYTCVPETTYFGAPGLVGIVVGVVLLLIAGPMLKLMRGVRRAFTVLTR